MKHLIIFFIFTAVLYSCNINDYPEPKESLQRWVFAGYQEGGLENPSYISVRDSAYIYTLSSNGTFRKSIGNSVFSGTYEERFEGGLKKFFFQYEKEDELVLHSCDSDQEIYFLNSKGQLTGTWDACDGDKLYFNKE